MILKYSVILFALAMGSLFVLETIRNRKEGSKVDASRDAGSLKLIAICRNAAFLFGIVAWFFPLFRLPGSSSIHWLAGAFLVFGGVLLRRWAMTSLGPWFTNVVSVQESQKIIKHGLYKYIRHPAYAGAFLVFLGFGIATGSVWGLVLIMALIGCAFLNRIKVEEKVLIECFGVEYRDYMKTTKKIIPFIY